MALRRRILPEHAFASDSFAPFYDAEMIKRRWNGLWYSTEEFYHYDLVEQFYKKRELEGDRIFIKVERARRELTRQLLAELLGISLESNLVMTIQESQYTGVPALMKDTVLEGEYNPTSHCACQSTLRTNQLAVAQWIGRNVLGKDKVSDIGLQCLHVLWILQTNKYNFCILDLMFNVIRGVEKSLVPLLVLITKIMLSFRAVARSAPIKIKLHSNASIYTDCIQETWPLSEEKMVESEDEREDMTCLDEDALDNCNSNLERMQVLQTALRCVYGICGNIRDRQIVVQKKQGNLQTRFEMLEGVLDDILSNMETIHQHQQTQYAVLGTEMEAQRLFRIEMLRRMPPVEDSVSAESDRHERRHQKTDGSSHSPSQGQSPSQGPSSSHN